MFFIVLGFVWMRTNCFKSKFWVIQKENDICKKMTLIYKCYFAAGHQKGKCLDTPA